MTPIWMAVNNKVIDLWKISSDDLSFDEIVRSISKIPRWAGQNPGHTYPVSRHSVVLSYLVPEKYAIEALLHDTPEFLTSDIPSPIKEAFPELKKLEGVILEAIFDRYNPFYSIGDTLIHEEVHEWDVILRVWEYYHLFKVVPPWMSSVDARKILDKVVSRVPSRFAEPIEYGPAVEEFNQRYLELI